MTRVTRITDDMYAQVPVLVAEGKTKTEIAELYGTTPGSLQVQCSRRGISLRKGGYRIKTVILREEALALSDDAMKSLSKVAQLYGRPAARLATDLLEKIAIDDLYRAVLDEEAA